MGSRTDRSRLVGEDVAIANRTTPSLNPTHTTPHSASKPIRSFWPPGPMSHQPCVGEFRKQFFLAKSINCECGETLHTQEHITRTCARYMIQQAKLRDKHRELATFRTQPRSLNSSRPRRIHLHGRKIHPQGIHSNILRRAKTP